IKVCRALGTSTKELQQIFTEKNMDELLKFLALKREETEQKIKEMQAVAGIVIDSNPENEYKESLKKAIALWR
ncbi:hypothetical protein ACT453_61195, partial [Bacillus sp. D-CC]